MKKSINIFCIVAKTGAGKTEYLNRIFADRKFIEKYDLSMLVYGTTRNKRPGEEEGKDYFYVSQEEYEKIPSEDLVEFRSYYTLNDGTVYYFTKKEHFDNGGNIICITSPFQYESYRNWCAKENIKGNKYNLFMIIIDAEVKCRIERLMKRANKDSDIYEMCRRVIQEKSEFEDVSKRVPELIDPMMATNVCYIDNNSSEEKDIEANLNRFKDFIRRYLD